MEKIEIGTATLYHADAFEVLPTLTDGEVDNVISDMPFGVTACDWDVVPPLDQLWELMEAKAKATANFILFACGGFTFDLVNSKRSWYRYDLCWAKNNRTGFLNAALQPLRAHENILIFGRPGFQKTATYNAIKVPGGRPRVSRTRTRASGGVYPPQPPHTTISDGTTNPISVLAFNKDNNLPDWCAHPTQKPETLLGYLILMYSNPNDLIIDPFMGSCSTGSAAMRLGRRFIGIEREKEFFDISCRRLWEIHQRRTARYRPSEPVDSPTDEPTVPEEESAMAS